MDGDPRSGLDRLRRAADTGELDDICERHGVRVLSAFGSTVRGGVEPRDLDVGVLFRVRGDVLGLLEDLVALTGTERVDLADLGRAGPVLRERALVGAVALYEAEAGDYARAQMAAMLERMDTDWLRRLDLELMAE
jgi:predicted nucleotidyltransferase